MTEQLAALIDRSEIIADIRAHAPAPADCLCHGRSMRDGR
jgi:hypothetical protein